MSRRLLLPGIAALAALAILVGLGAWQLGRRTEKAAILAGLERSVTAASVPLDGPALRRLKVSPAGASADGALPELTRVEVRGAFLTEASVPVRATLPTTTRGAVTGGIGFFWMTPLRLADGATVFINRGFVPTGADFRPPAIRTPQGERTVTGLLRLPETARFFTPSDDPARGEYFVRDIAALAHAARLEPTVVAPFFIDAERAAGDAMPPVGIDAREMIARIPNNHLQYAVTWFGLALTLVGVFAAFAWTRLKERTSEP